MGEVMTLAERGSPFIAHFLPILSESPPALSPPAKRSWAERGRRGEGGEGGRGEGAVTGVFSTQLMHNAMDPHIHIQVLPIPHRTPHRQSRPAPP